MSQDQDNNIIIDFVEPQKHPQEDLMGCYFVYDWSNDTYCFFEEGNDKPLATGLQRGDHFDFTLSYHPHLKWKLHISKKSTPVMVEGGFHTPKHIDLMSGDWEPEGSYQATAGGSGGVEPETNSATANA